MEDIAPYPLPNSHAQVDEETDTSDSDSGIFLICRCKICIVMLVRVSVGVTSSQGHGCAYSNERQASWALTTTDEWGIRADCSQCRMRAADLRRCVKVLCDPKYSRNVSKRCIHRIRSTLPRHAISSHDSVRLGTKVIYDAESSVPSSRHSRQLS